MKRGRNGGGKAKAGGGGGREKGGQLRQAERMQPLLSPGAYDIEQQRQSIRSNIQQAPAQWIVARGRRGGGRATWTRERGRGEDAPAIKSRACRDPPWITALIESLSDVPWSRVILLPKQLLSSMVYSHLFHPAAPADPPRPPSALHVPLSLSLSLFPSFPSPPSLPASDTSDLARSSARSPRCNILLDAKAMRYHTSQNSRGGRPLDFIANDFIALDRSNRISPISVENVCAPPPGARSRNAMKVGLKNTSQNIKLTRFRLTNVSHTATLRL